ncbi:GmrSD restriction endonuclease domain-containing protein [Shewanella glacialipiscicola]|uniref:GmrSD restriction endonuclease domain-containing protein n=1 Tax=Shewanella glacialipiscicola TaxID=614069 RepID=UPI003D7AAABF
MKLNRVALLILVCSNLVVPNSALAKSNYNRSDYPHWSDLDGNGRNTRQDLLATLSTVPVSYSSNERTVTRGRWISSWTGGIYINPRELEIDHTVALGYAHARGGKYWSLEQREIFANDPRNLQAVEGALNRQKGAAGITEWLPPKNQCQYIARFHRIMLTYKLSYYDKERVKVNELISKCSL